MISVADQRKAAKQIAAAGRFNRMFRRVCQQCGHTWLKRREQDPKVCPKCKRTDWNGK